MRKNGKENASTEIKNIKDSELSLTLGEKASLDTDISTDVEDFNNDEGTTDSKDRKLTDIQRKFVKYLAIIFSVYHLITIFQPLNLIQQRIIHLMFGLVLIFTLKPMIKSKKQKIYWYDYIFLIATLGACLYIVINGRKLCMERLGMYTDLEVFIAIVIVILVLEATRRLFGWIMPLIAITALLYAYFGRYIPGIVGHRGYSVSRIATTMSLWTEGILGAPLGVSATFVAVFVIFGAFLQQTNIGQFFIRLSYASLGRVRGGPAKGAVIASGFFGSVSGSPVANVVGTGTFTIPLMKRLGFEANFAGAVEAVASSGGQLMPPVMGATAFIMAEMVNVPYPEIIKAALIPALLYYIVLFYTVDIRAAKLGIKGERPENLENPRLLFREGWFLLLPLLVLIFALVILRVSTGKAAIYAILVTIIVSLLNKKDRLTFKKFLDSLETGAYGMISIVSITALAGIISGVLSMTGLGLKISGLLVNLAGGNLIILLVLSMIVSIIAGMGLPIVACYLLLGVIVAPAIISMGVAVISAHFFIFVFGIFSVITPPVAVAAYVAAGIAEADPIKTGYAAWKLALPLFLLPYAFVYSPTLIMQGVWHEILINSLTAMLGLFLFASALEGYIWRYKVDNWILRGALLLAGVTTIIPGIATDFIGFGMGLVVLVILHFLSKSEVTHT